MSRKTHTQHTHVYIQINLSLLLFWWAAHRRQPPESNRANRIRFDTKQIRFGRLAVTATTKRIELNKKKKSNPNINGNALESRIWFRWRTIKPKRQNSLTRKNKYVFEREKLIRTTHIHTECARKRAPITVFRWHSHTCNWQRDWNEFMKGIPILLIGYPSPSDTHTHTPRLSSTQANQKHFNTHHVLGGKQKKDFYKRILILESRESVARLRSSPSSSSFLPSPLSWLTVILLCIYLARAWIFAFPFCSHERGNQWFQ